MSTAYSDGVFYARNNIVNPSLVAAVKDLEPGVAADIGCGMGPNAEFLTQAGWDVWLVEREDLAVMNLRQRFNPERILQADLRTLDFSLLPKLDLVTCNYVVQHLSAEEVVAFFKAVLGKLKDGGRFVLSNFERKDAVPFEFLARVLTESGCRLAAQNSWGRWDLAHGPAHFHRGVESLWIRQEKGE